MRRWKVLLFGYYGMGNLGDELLASACVNLLESCGIRREEMAMLSGNPGKSTAAHGIFAIDRGNTKEIFSALKNSETLLLGGGGIFQDSSSARSPAYYWGIVRTAKICGCKVWAVGQSIGPLRYFASRAMARDAFSLCDAVSVRDRHSFEFLAKSRNGAQNVIQTDDLALALPPNFPGSPHTAQTALGKKFAQTPHGAQGEKFAQTPQGAQTGKKDIFLVNFRASRNRAGGEKNLETAAAEDFKNFHLPAGKRVVGVAMDKDDAKTMEQLARRGLVKLDEILTPEINDVEKIFPRAVGGFGMRLHFGVMCLRAGIPFGMVPYDPKVSDFARRWNVPLWPDVSQENKENHEKREFQENQEQSEILKCPHGGENSLTEADLAEIGEKIRGEFRECFERVFVRGRDKG